MRIVSASDIKNKLGDLFDAVEKDEGVSVLIERNHRPVAMLLNAQIAEKVILGAYAQGVLSRSTAMQQLGIEWYGDLLVRMNIHRINRPVVPAGDCVQMLEAVDQAFASSNKALPAKDLKRDA